MADKTVNVTIKGKNEIKPALDSAAQDVEAFGGVVKSLMNPLALLQGAVAALGIGALGGFFRAATTAAADAGASIQRLTTQLANAGLTSASSAARINDLANALQNTTRFGNDQIRDAFTDLLSITNDYSGSIKNLQLVLDVATAKQLDLHTAANLVGRAMEGDTGTLKRYGIVVAAGTDAIQAMSDRFRNAAETDGKTFQARIEQLKNAGGDLMKELGFLITGDDNLADATHTVTEKLEAMADWINRNADGIRTLAEGFAHFIVQAEKVSAWVGGHIADMILPGATDALGAAMHRSSTGTFTVSQINATQPAAAPRAQTDAERQQAIAARVKAIGDETKGLLDQITLLHRSVDQDQQLVALATKLKGLRDDQANSMEVQLAAAKALQQVEASSVLQNEKKLAGISTDASGLKVSAINTAPTRMQPITTLTGVRSLAGDNRSDFTKDFAAGFDNATKSAKKLNDSVVTVGNTIGGIAGGAVIGFANTWTSAVSNIIAGNEKLGVAIVKATRQAVGASVTAKGRETLLDAGKAFVEGFDNPVKFLQAAKLFGIGTAELALGAELSGGGGGGGGGSSGGGGGLSAQNAAAQQGTINGQGAVTVYVSGKKTTFDSTDADDRQAFKDMIQSVAGDREVDFVFTDTGS